MRRSAVVASAVALMVAIACSSGVGAEVPPLNGTPTVASGPTAIPVPTSTPWPRFGPPPVTAADITATAQAIQATPVVTTPTPDGGIGSNGSSAPDPEPNMPAATATPSSPTPLDNSGTFVPAVEYHYFVPAGWTEVIGDDEIVLEDPSGLAHVTLRERPVDRSKVFTVHDLVSLDQPVPFTDWNNRSLSDSRPKTDLTHEFTYAGTKYGEPFVAIVQWHLRGELLIEVVTEAPAGTWALNSNLRNSAALAAASFAPVPDVALALPAEVENLLMARFNQRPSGIFLPSNGNIARVEQTCRQVFYDLLSAPVYVGFGTWQVYAVGDQGAQVWQIFEPSLSIVASANNTSTC